jgi:hypothetical protein
MAPAGDLTELLNVRPAAIRSFLRGPWAPAQPQELPAQWRRRGDGCEGAVRAEAEVCRRLATHGGPLANNSGLEASLGAAHRGRKR